MRGDPAERRRFLDDLLVARRPRFAAVRADYDRVLRQRSALLKTARNGARSSTGADLRTLDVWDGHLARHGAALLAGRLELVRRSRRTGRRGVRRGGAVVRADRARLPLLAGRANCPRTPTTLEPMLLDAPAARCAARRWSAACVWSARTATIWSCALGDGPGEGVREPRRVVGAGPGAAAGLLPAAVCGRRRAGADPRRRVRRAGRPAPPGAGRSGRAGRAGAGHRRGRRRRAGRPRRRPVCGERRPDRACSCDVCRRAPRQRLEHDHPRVVDKVVDTVDNFGSTGDEQRRRPSAGPRRPPVAGESGELSPGLGTTMRPTAGRESARSDAVGKPRFPRPIGRITGPRGADLAREALRAAREASASRAAERTAERSGVARRPASRRRRWSGPGPGRSRPAAVRPARLPRLAGPRLVAPADRRDGPRALAAARRLGHRRPLHAAVAARRRARAAGRVDGLGDAAAYAVAPAAPPARGGRREGRRAAHPGGRAQRAERGDTARGTSEDGARATRTADATPGSALRHVPPAARAARRPYSAP